MGSNLSAANFGFESLEAGAHAPEEQPSLPDGPPVTVIGAGLAGAEAAWQAAQRGCHVFLYEMRPSRMTPAHHTSLMAELVCSNSFGSNASDRALGLLKNELRRLRSVVVACADENAVPAGQALAVGRDAFSEAVTKVVCSHPNISVIREELSRIPSGVTTVVASGPLTSPDLAREIAIFVGERSLSFFDAMAPIVAGDTVNMEIAFRASRYGREAGALGDYINCPFDDDEYRAFVLALTSARRKPLHDFERMPESVQYFEACLPVEVLADRGAQALAYGPMRPVGLRDPRTGLRPAAVVQLRQDDAAGSLYNLVGFQTNLEFGEQERVLRTIPGLEVASFVRLGQMHRNTYLCSPRVLLPTLQSCQQPQILFAGQITGTEGYVGSVASGMVAGLNAARVAHGLTPVVLAPTTMVGALIHYITHAQADGFQPMKANMGLLPPLEATQPGKRWRNAALADRSSRDLEAAIRAEGL